MKKVFMILLAVFLVLSMTGMVSASPTTQTATEETMVNDVWTSEFVNVTLNLENDYVVTIPADIVLETRENESFQDNTVKVKVYASPSPATVSTAVTLLGAKQLLNVTLTSEYYEDYGWEAATDTDSQPQITSNSRAWFLNETGDNKLHYAILKGNTHIQPYADYADGKLTLVRNSADSWVNNGDQIISSNESTTVNLHMMVIDKPTVVAEYMSKLTFKVELIDKST